MRFNTPTKRKRYEKEMIYWLKTHGYILGTAEEITAKWIKGGVSGVKGEIVKEDVRLAMLNVVYGLKRR